MKIRHVLTLSLVVLIIMMLFPSLVLRVYGSDFVTPITIVIRSKSHGDIYPRDHGLTIDSPMPEVWWTGDWYDENPDVYIGTNPPHSNFYYEKTVDELQPGQHVIEYAVRTSVGYWHATIEINGEVVATGNVTRYEHLTASFEILPKQHDLTVSLDTPSLLEPSDSSLLNATVTNWGSNNETNVELLLLINGAIIDNVTVPELLTNSSYTLSCVWTPIEEDNYNVTAYAHPVPGENSTTNNIATKVVYVSDRTFFSTITFAVSSKTHGDYGATIHALTIDNPIPEVFWQGEWYEENPDAIIKRGGIFSLYYKRTVELPPGQHVIEYAISTPAGCGHWDATIRINGEVVALGEVTRYEHLTASFEVVRPQHDLTVSLDAPTSLELGDSSLLNATVTNWGSNNETNVELLLLINGAVVDSVTIPELLTDSSYTFSYLWTPTVEASYNVTAYASPVSGENITTNNIVTKLVDVFKLTAVYVDPETTTAAVGDTFVIDVKLANVTDLFGYEFKLFWDTTLLDCVSSTINRIWYPNDLIIKNEILEDYDATHGRYWCAYTSLGAPSFSGNTTLASLTFEATEGSMEGRNCTLDLCDVQLVNSEAEIIQDWDDKDSPDDGYVTIYGSNTTCVIRADGSIFPSTTPISSVDNVTYTLTANIARSILVERDNIVVDGTGYTLQGTGAHDSKGIDLAYRSNVTIKNMRIESFGYGIWLSHSSNNTISGNTIKNNNYGIRIDDSSNNIISGNTITDSGFGIWLENSSSNIISENKITDCGMFGMVLYSSSSNNTLYGNNMTNNSIGIWLSESSRNTFSENMMDGNLVNFGGVSGYELSHFMHSIDVSNLVNGKPVYYLVNQTDLIINSVTHQVGYLALINCDNVTVEGLTLTNNGEGILLAYTNNSRITDNNIIDNHHGVVLFMSFNNTLSKNAITDNYAEGFYLELCSNNTVSGNTIKNSWWGIQLYGSSNNSIYHNNFVDNTVQIYTEDSVNVWDDGYPSGGNYWNDHNPPDIYSGPYQNETGGDGIGDTPYIINENNTDKYPLIYPYGYVPSPDANQDGIVDIVDLSIVSIALWSTPGEPEWKPIADLNYDNLIDVVDLTIVTIHLWETW